MMKTKKFLWIDLLGFCNGMVLYAPVAILVRLNKGVSLSWFFYLQAILSFLIFLLEIPSGILTDKIGYKKSLILNQILLCLCKLIFLIGFGVTFFLLETIIEAIAATFSSAQSMHIYILFVIQIMIYIHMKKQNLSLLDLQAL